MKDQLTSFFRDWAEQEMNKTEAVKQLELNRVVKSS